MRHLAIYIFGLFTLSSCNEVQNNKSLATQSPSRTPRQPSNHAKLFPNIPEVYRRDFGIETITCGPRGGVYNNASGKFLPYRIFRVQLINDTVYPVELSVKFPNKPVALFPDTTQFIKTFLFPDELTPDTIQDTYNFGVTKLESFLETGLNTSTTLNTLIQPKETRILYIGAITGEIARAELLVNAPIKSLATNTKNKNTLDLIFSIRIDPSHDHSLIHCGEIV